MHWCSLKVIISRTHQSPSLEARRGAAIVRSIIDPPAPRMNVKSLPRCNTIRSFLAILTDQDFPPVQMGFYLLGRLTVKVARSKRALTSLSEAFLKEDYLGLENYKRIVGRQVAAVHTYPRHLHPNEPRISLQKIRDAQIRATNKDPSRP